MRKKWSRDPKEIMELVSTFIDTELPITLQLSGNSVLRSKIFRIHYHGEWPYLLILRPAGLESANQLKSFLFKMSGFPILGFDCQVQRESANILAVRLPNELFQLELRKDARQNPLSGSMATFFIEGRARVSICLLENISMGGAKLVGSPAHHIRENNIVGPCTMSLVGRDALISREVTVNRAHIVRIADNEGRSGELVLGLSFDLRMREKDQLFEHLESIAKM